MKQMLVYWYGKMSKIHHVLKIDYARFHKLVTCVYTMLASA